MKIGIRNNGIKVGLCSYFSILYLNLDINRINYWFLAQIKIGQKLTFFFYFFLSSRMPKIAMLPH